MRNILISILVIMFVGSCNHYKHFTNIKEPVKDNKVNLNMNGVYFADNQRNKSYISDRYFFFFPDGSVYIGSGPTEFVKWTWNNEKFDTLNKKNYNYSLSRKGMGWMDFGTYIIRDSIIKVQHFEPISRNNQRGVVDTYFKIKNDTTIYFYYIEHSYKDEIYTKGHYKEKYMGMNSLGLAGRYTALIEPPIEYNFHKYDQPDNNLVWFKKKWWYEKFADESRK